MKTKIDADINCYQLGIQDFAKYYHMDVELIIKLQDYLEACILRDRQYKTKDIFNDVEAMINDWMGISHVSWLFVREHQWKKLKEKYLPTITAKNTKKDS